MSRPSSFSLRGRKAIVAIKDERDATIVRRQFERLGVDSIAWEPTEAIDFAPDLALIDDEFLPLTQPARRAFLGRCPVIALLGTETPSRLKLVFELDSASCLVKPLHSVGAYAALGYEHRNLFGQSWLWTSRAELGRSLTRVSSESGRKRDMICSRRSTSASPASNTSDAPPFDDRTNNSMSVPIARKACAAITTSS